MIGQHLKMIRYLLGKLDSLSTHAEKRGAVLLINLYLSDVISYSDAGLLSALPDAPEVPAPNSAIDDIPI